MTWYHIEFITEVSEPSRDHQTGANILDRAGVLYTNRSWIYEKTTEHRIVNGWDVKCTEEQLTMIALLGGEMIQ